RGAAVRAGREAPSGAGIDDARREDLVTASTAPRVLQVVLSLDTGGTERLVIQICTKLQHRFGMAVCCLDAPGTLARELTGRGIEVAAIHRDAGFRPSR